MNATATTRQQTPAPRLALLLAVSLLLHLLLLWLLALPATTRTAANSLTIRMSAALSSAPVSSLPATRQEQPARATTSPQQHSATAAEETAEPHEDVAAITPTVTTFDESRFNGNSTSFGNGEKVELSSAQSENRMAMVRAQLLSRFAEHFHYPLLAQKRNWQGVVILSFRVAQDGTLQDIEVAQSSGIGMLDSAAVESLNAIGQLEFTTENLLRAPLELHLPVVYHLAQR